MYEDDDLVFAKNLRINSKKKKPDWITVLNKKEMDPDELEDFMNEFE